MLRARWLRNGQAQCRHRSLLRCLQFSSLLCGSTVGEKGPILRGKRRLLYGPTSTAVVVMHVDSAPCRSGTPPYMRADTVAWSYRWDVKPHIFSAKAELIVIGTLTNPEQQWSLSHAVIGSHDFVQLLRSSASKPTSCLCITALRRTSTTDEQWSAKIPSNVTCAVMLCRYLGAYA